MEFTKKYDRWTDDEVQALISVFAEEEIQRELETAIRNEKVYLKISSRLYELGIVHTGKQCREKLKKLKQDYKKVKDHNNRSGSDRRTNKWFDRLDALLGHRPAFSGAAVTKDSAIAFLESIHDSEDQSVEDEMNGPNDVQATETSVFSPAITSSPRPMSSAETHTRRGKRKRDCDFLDALRDMEDSNRTALQLGQEQRDKYMQLLLESQAEEREMRRQELAFLQSEAEESRRQQRDFQAGFLSVLGQFAQSFKK
ncbi:zinc finger and SCAN domain-containing protein 29-like [Rhinichthys klamathensis goyatoka]|uniref:zinc finger and SCAN domain-containing protein 29-like n=1 Tax=Rhinichthys klamathensis goyatoka TaxID=3034132 RepID=UPI0024B4BDA2|nr:zinc finger and SCAN domain-containing protein 29-like [Rhinichthys klamathensis goyatoka]XP_056108225.1 zinc finger and SCAN domain-containing protein 29-like [Rhinichthys klamathensis goyatoka]